MLLSLRLRFEHFFCWGGQSREDLCKCLTITRKWGGFGLKVWNFCHSFLNHRRCKPLVEITPVFIATDGETDLLKKYLIEAGI